MKNTHPLKMGSPDTALTIERPETLHNTFYHLAGLGIHVLNKIRHEVRGYTSARGFSTSDIARAIRYDFSIVKRWMDYLQVYKPAAASMRGKNVLELGPGADLGVGLITLAEKASNYYAMDVHNLTRSVPDSLYESLFNFFEKIGYNATDITQLRHQLQLASQNKSERLNYLVRKDFDLTVFAGKEIDMVLSNSAFQQFDDPAKTIAQLNEVVHPGAVFVGLIDLKTHTRWIKPRDPLNIYRYSDALYNKLRFRGMQNRVRPFEFKKALEENGWEDVQIYPRLQLADEYLSKINSSLHPRFRDKINEMTYLTIVICAIKGKG